MNLVGLLVKIKSEKNRAKYPPFGTLAVVQASGLDWSEYVDVYGKGWHYDKTSGHRDESAHSPLGEQLGLLLVEKAFADQAVAAFPAECSLYSEVETEAFYNDRAHVREADLRIDQKALSELNSYLTLVEKVGSQDEVNKVKARVTKALDKADDNTAGVVENKGRYWATYKVAQSIVYK